MYPEDFLKKIKDFFSGEQYAEIEHATEFASSYHRNQKRKSGEPYIIHPVFVAYTLVKWGADSDTVIAGLLHDVVEDTEATFDDIENLFGYSVTLIVDGVTKNDSKYFPEFSSAIDKLRLAGAKDPRVYLVKLADRLHNLSTLRFMSPEKQVKKATESIEIYTRVAHQISFGVARRKIEELSFGYIEPELSKKYKRFINSEFRRNKKSFHKLIKNLKINFKKNGIESIIELIPYDNYRLYREIKRNPKNDLHKGRTVAKMIIITPETSDCYSIQHILSNNYEVSNLIDRIENPAPNHYQSLRSILKTKDSEIEINIMTEKMYEFSEYGFLSNPNLEFNPLKESDFIKKYPEI